MKKVLYYLYYRLFEMHSRGEEISLGAFLSVITTSFMFWLNIFTLAGFLNKINVLPIFFNKDSWIIFMIVLFVVDYFFFMHKKKFEEIILMFKNESKREKIKGGLLVLLYILLSVAAFVIMVLYKPGQL
jgi:hypothetical protein